MSSSAHLVCCRSMRKDSFLLKIGRLLAQAKCDVGSYLAEVVTAVDTDGRRHVGCFGNAT